jgi:anti-anti-sigma regulatory factor
VDLTEVGFCGSTGLEALVRLQEGGAQAGVPVRIHPTPRLRRLVGLTGLDGTLNLAEPETP